MAGLTRDECYERLNILDAKCTSLLQLCAVLAVIQTIPVAASGAPPWVRVIGAASILVFLLVSFMAVDVLSVDWEPCVAVVDRRTRVLDRCRHWTRLGLLLGGTFLIAAVATSVFVQGSV